MVAAMMLYLTRVFPATVRDDDALHLTVLTLSLGAALATTPAALMIVLALVITFPVAVARAAERARQPVTAGRAADRAVY
jgi:hypothetical protein